MQRVINRDAWFLQIVLGMDGVNVEFERSSQLLRVGDFVNQRSCLCVGRNDRELSCFVLHGHERSRCAGTNTDNVYKTSAKFLSRGLKSDSKCLNKVPLSDCVCVIRWRNDDLPDKFG